MRLLCYRGFYNNQGSTVARSVIEGLMPNPETNPCLARSRLRQGASASEQELNQQTWRACMCYLRTALGPTAAVRAKAAGHEEL